MKNPAQRSLPPEELVRHQEFLRWFRSTFPTRYRWGVASCPLIKGEPMSGYTIIGGSVGLLWSEATGAHLCLLYSSENSWAVAAYRKQLLATRNTYRRLKLEPWRLQFRLDYWRENKSAFTQSMGEGTPFRDIVNLTLLLEYQIPS